MPGKPPPAPKSTHTFASGAKSMSCSEFGNVPRPDLRKRRGCDQIRCSLPEQQRVYEHVQALFRFT